MSRLSLSVLVLSVASTLALPALTLAQGSEPPAPPFEPQTEDPFASAPEPVFPDLDELLAPYLGDLDALPAPEGPEGEPAEPTASPAPLPLRTREDHVARAAELFEDEGLAPVVGLPTGKVHPFGQDVPEIVCLPFRACDLELQTGETIDGLVLGDPERWSSQFLFEGPETEPIPHIVLKPSGFDLRTNAVVVTSRRTYHLELRSPKEDEAKPTEYHHHVSWWYPEDWVRRVRAERARSAARGSAPPASPVATPLDLSALSFGYRIEVPGRPKSRLAWQPVTVFDDGRRTFLRLPPEARDGDLPAVLGQLADGSLYPLESRLAGQWLIVPEVAERIELVLGAGKTRKSLTLVKEGVSR